VQPDVPVLIVDVSIELAADRSGREEDNASLDVEVLLAVINERLDPGGRIVLELEKDVVSETRSGHGNLGVSGYNEE
jgi:hypothetical protein